MQSELSAKNAKQETVLASEYKVKAEIAQHAQPTWTNTSTQQDVGDARLMEATESSCQKCYDSAIAFSS